MLARKRSPVETWGIPSFFQRGEWLGCLYLPQEGRRVRVSLEESFVVALHLLAFQLFNRVEANTDENQHCGTTEREVVAGATGPDADQEVRQNSDNSEVEGTNEEESVHNEAEVLGSGAAGANAGDEAAVFFMLSACSVGSNCTDT